MSIYRHGRFKERLNKRPYTMRKLFNGCLILLIVLTLALPLQAKDTVTVLSIVDGDTLGISYQGREESIRLIGIDAPESRPNKKAKSDAQRSGEDLKTILATGKKSTGYVKTLVKPGDTVSIEFDVQSRDKYRRLLGYVYLSNGKMLNEEIVRAGYANVMTVPPNVKYQERFLGAYREARENSRGLWGK